MTLRASVRERLSPLTDFLAWLAHGPKGERSRWHRLG